MKQLRSLLMLGVLSLSFVQLKAEVVTIDSVLYFYQDNDIHSYVTGFVDGVKCVNIVDSVCGRSVYSIFNRAFNGCESLETITISNSVLAVGSYAFEDCENLVNVHFSQISSVISLGSDAFYECAALEHIYIPSSLYSDFVNDSMWASVSSLISGIY